MKSFKDFIYESHEFVQQELAKHDINSEIVHHPTKTKLYVDQDDQMKAREHLKRIGHEKDYDVRSRMGSAPSIKRKGSNWAGD